MAYSICFIHKIGEMEFAQSYTLATDLVCRPESPISKPLLHPSLFVRFPLWLLCNMYNILLWVINSLIVHPNTDPKLFIKFGSAFWERTAVKTQYHYYIWILTSVIKWYYMKSTELCTYKVRFCDICWKLSYGVSS